MGNISIVTDSTSYLPQYVCKDHDLTVVPLSVMLGGRIYIDNGTDIEPDKFYKMLKDSKEMPAASQPTPGDFIKTYSNLLNGSDKIISLHIFSKLSGTINSARLAAKNLAGEKI